MKPWEKRSQQAGPWAKYAAAPETINDVDQFLGKSTPMAGPINVDSGGPAGSMDFLLGLPALRGTMPYRVMQGMADPGIAAIQMGAEAIGRGDAVSGRIQEVAQDRAAARGYDPARGAEPFDFARLAGNIAITAPMAAALTPTLAANAGMGAQMLAGATTGARFGLLNPVEQETDSFWTAKAKQGAAGAAGGALAVPVAAAAGRVLSPRGNADVAALEAAGVQPTIGQRLGGVWNTAEQKLQSVPILGDAITSARNRARGQFGTAAVNEALDPLGRRVTTTGSEAVNEATQIVSGAYDDAANMVRGVVLDQPARQQLGRLQQLAQRLTPDMARRFNDILNDELMSRVSPAGGMESVAFKTVDSTLGRIAARYGKGTATEQELGDAVIELSRILRETARRQSPGYATALDAADAAYARLVRVQEASKLAKGADGVFTPGQLLSGVSSADQSVRKNAVARGEALMQDFASQGQRVLGNAYPDSGTAGRLALGLGAIASGAINPLIPIGLAGSAALYMPQSQRLIGGVMGARPVMEPVSQALRQYAPIAGGLLAPSIVPRQ